MAVSSSIFLYSELNTLPLTGTYLSQPPLKHTHCEFSTSFLLNSNRNGTIFTKLLSFRPHRLNCMRVNKQNNIFFDKFRFINSVKSPRIPLTKCKQNLKTDSVNHPSNSKISSKNEKKDHSLKLKIKTEPFLKNSHSSFFPSFLSSFFSSFFSSKFISLHHFQKTFHPFTLHLPFVAVSKRMIISFGVVTLFVIMTNVTGFATLHKSWALTEENLLFLEAWRTIDRAYVDKTFNGQTWFRYRQDALKKEPMNNREETYAAIRKMLASLDDPFTKHLEPDKFKTLKAGATGAVTGVGLEVGFNKSGNLVVVSPVSNGPADRAGISPGDRILAIDEASTLGMGLYEAAQRLQGPILSEVKLLIQNSLQSTPIVYNITREKISLNPVSYQLCTFPNKNFKLGYIRLSTFNQNSAMAVKEAIRNLKEENTNAFVLDIRNNGGGLFPAGVEISKYWLEKGVIVYIADSVGIKDVYESDGSTVLSINEPLTILVNKGTASASEILAGALKDNKRATILGESTFGKGKIQSIFELSDGSGLAVTIARYQTPNQIDIDKVGILPDAPLPEALTAANLDSSKFCSCFENVDSDISAILSLFSGPST